MSMSNISTIVMHTFGTFLKISERTVYLICLKKVQALVFGIIQGNWEKHNKYIIYHPPTQLLVYPILAKNCTELPHITVIFHLFFILGKGKTFTIL